MQTVVSAQFLGVHPQLYIHNVKLQITTKFVVIFFYLATVLNRKAAFIKQRSKTQLFETLFSKDFFLSTICCLSVYCDNSYVKLFQKYKVFLYLNGYTAS